MKSYLITAGFLIATVAGPARINKRFKRSHISKSNQDKANDSKPVVDYIILLNKSARHMDTEALESSTQFLKIRLENIEKSDYIHDYSKCATDSIPKSILTCLKSINPTQIPLAISLLEVTKLQSKNKDIVVRASSGPTQMARSNSKRRLSDSSADIQFEKFTKNVSKLIYINNNNRALVAC